MYTYVCTHTTYLYIYIIMIYLCMYKLCVCSQEMHFCKPKRT